MKAAVLILTDQGLKTAERIIYSWPGEDLPELWIHRNCQEESTQSSAQVFAELKAIVPKLWKECSVLVFIMATGIVVRQIAPLLQSKDRDPAVLVLDEKGEYVIPLLSGHLGGANTWAREVAYRIKAKPVLTTATDVRGYTAPDEYARRFRWTVEPLVRLHSVNRYLLDYGYLNVWSDYKLPEDHPLCQDSHYRFVDESDKDKAHVWISVKEAGLEDTPLHLIPRVFSIGVGCRRGVSGERILKAVQASLDHIGVSRKSIQGIYSIDLKADEAGIQEAAEVLGVPFKTFSPENVQGVIEEKALARSNYVRDMIGVDGVCEATSLLGTKQGEMVLPKQKMNGVTVAISQEKSLSWELDPVMCNI